jgi:ribosomal protein S18 acetylase RimI-like enzyme
MSGKKSAAARNRSMKSSRTNPPPIKIRSATIDDAAAIADLAGQLGYATPKTIMRKRLELVLNEDAAACFLAATEDEEVVGWIHISVTPLLEVNRRAEVNGLIVSDQLRGQGAGRLLLEAAERWARQLKCTGMSVRSNVIRDRAHAFYLKNGYEHYKTQKAFRKRL